MDLTLTGISSMGAQDLDLLLHLGLRQRGGGDAGEFDAVREDGDVARLPGEGGEAVVALDGPVAEVYELHLNLFLLRVHPRDGGAVEGLVALRPAPLAAQDLPPARV